MLDCATDLVWLKDASCAELPGTDSEGRANWDAAKLAAAALADGTCGLTDGSMAGDWRLPEIGEFCSAFAGSPLFPCPDSAAPDSLIDSSVSGPPTVVNAEGTAQWSEGDAFVGVQSLFYWSATVAGAGNAWFVFLGNGVNASGEVGSNFVWPVRARQ